LLIAITFNRMVPLTARGGSTVAFKQNHIRLTLGVVSWPIFWSYLRLCRLPKVNFDCCGSNFYRLDALPVTKPTSSKHWRMKWPLGHRF